MRALLRWLKRNKLLVLIPCLALLAVLAWSLTHQRSERAPKPPISAFSQLEPRMRAGYVSRLEWNPTDLKLKVQEKNKNTPDYTIVIPILSGSNEGLARIIAVAREKNIRFTSKPLSATRPGLVEILGRWIPTLLIVLLLLWILRSYMPAGGRKLEAAKSSNKFGDVAGCDEAIEELRDVRAFLAHPRKYERLGARVPKGVLLHGPPGTGKTLLAKAVANEAGIPFYSASGSEFVEMYAGLGARRVRQLFQQAKKTAPSIIFIDELDAVGAKRSSGSGDSGMREADQTLIQILKEMDGFDVSEHPVIVVGATNRLDTLDTALTRPGRFDRHISIDPPDKRGRLEILRVHSRAKRLGADVDLARMAKESAGMTGADLALWLNEAALLAARHDRHEVTASDVEDAYFRIVAGAKKTHRALSATERQRVAYHETGHAVVSEQLGASDKVHKISIIPRGRSGGQTLYVSEEDVFLYSEQDLREQLCSFLAGRAAEEIIFGQTSSGAADDLQRATSLAHKMVAQLGMGEAAGLRVETGEAPLSESIQAAVDQETGKLLDEAYQQAQAIILDQRDALERVAQALLEEETIDRERFLGLLGAEEQGSPTNAAGQKNEAEADGAL